MVIFLTPTVVRACSRPRCIDMISASVEVMLVACIFGLWMMASLYQICEMADAVLFLTPPSAMTHMREGWD